MSSSMVLSGLIIDDDEDNLKVLKESFEDNLHVEDYTLTWTTEKDFDKALCLLKQTRYDIVVTDVYKDTINIGPSSGLNIVKAVTSRYFCPVVVCSSGKKPQNLKETTFVRFADRSSDGTVESVVREIIQTGIPKIGSRLFDDIYSSSPNYLWEFLEKNWEKLGESITGNRDRLERLVRRRVSQMLDGGCICREDGSERREDGGNLSRVMGIEYYVYPPFEDHLTLGQILREESSGRWFVILTPRCHLAPHGGTGPKADSVLLAGTVEPKAVIRNASELKDATKRGRLFCHPLRKGPPEGRYWFLPGFLDMPNLYCDFLQLQSVPLAELEEKYEKFAVLDTPFAEALQSSFLHLYSGVGVPDLDSSPYMGILDES